MGGKMLLFLFSLLQWNSIHQFFVQTEKMDRLILGFVERNWRILRTSRPQWLLLKMIKLALTWIKLIRRSSSLYTSCETLLLETGCSCWTFLMVFNMSFRCRCNRSIIFATHSMFQLNFSNSLNMFLIEASEFSVIKEKKEEF